MLLREPEQPLSLFVRRLFLDWHVPAYLVSGASIIGLIARTDVVAAVILAVTPTAYLLERFKRVGRDRDIAEGAGIF